MNEIPKAVIIPSDPISAYEKNGYGGWLERYYNPAHTFQEVFFVSPLESGTTFKYGATIIGASSANFKRIVQDINPNIVRAYGGFWASDLAIANRIENVPIVVSLHDTSLDLIYDSVQYADKVFCMTNAVAQQAIKKHVSSEKIRILPNRIDPNIFYPRDSSEVANIAKNFPHGKSILHVGRKSSEKNLETVIKSLKFLPQEYFAVFVGRGNVSYYEQIAIKESVSNRCFWIDQIKNEELPIWYTWCNCMCTPSLREGFGIVFIEAMACGSPIVTSNISPLNEYLHHGENALLVDDYMDPSAIARSILMICEDDGLKRKLQSNAIQSSKNFHVEKIDNLEKDLYMEVYNECCKKRL
jgi:glycosyltransferase involved in cell wall biosynthesis